MTFFKNVVKKKIVINIIKLFSTNSFSFIFDVFPLYNLYSPFRYLKQIKKVAVATTGKRGPVCRVGKLSLSSALSLFVMSRPIIDQRLYHVTVSKHLHWASPY